MNHFRLKQIRWKDHWVYLGFLLGASLFLVVAIFIRQSSKESLEKISTQTQQQQSLNKASADALDIHDQYYPAYQNYLDRHIIGEADRLNWISTLDDLISATELPNMQFSLEKTRLIQEGETPFYSYSTPIYITDMHLNMTLLHEGDLYQLLDQFSAQTLGTFSVEQCDIARADRSLEEDNYKGLKAQCSLRWFNFQHSILSSSEALADVES